MRDNTIRAKNAIRIIWIYAGFNLLVSVITAVVMNQVASSIQDPLDLSGDNGALMSLMASGVLLIVMGLGVMGLFIANAILVIQWFRRAYYNQHEVFGSGMMRYTEGWASGGWFVPIAWWFIPFQIMKEMFDKATESMAGSEYNNDFQEAKSRLTPWWAFYVISSLISTVSSQLEDVVEYSYYISVASAVFLLIAGFNFVKLIKVYTFKVEPMLPAHKEGLTSQFGVQEEDQNWEEN